MLELLRQRLPSKRDAVMVFTVAAFMVYSWTMCVSFWKIPSWLMFMNIWEILSVYTYAFVVNFLESVLLLFLATLPSFFLPRNLWKEKFTPRGIALIVSILTSAQIHIHLYRTPDVQNEMLSGQLVWWISTSLIAFCLSWLVGKLNWVSVALVELADRLGLFMYIYLPLTAISSVAILVRAL